MLDEPIDTSDSWLSRIDLAAIPDLDDKLQECEYFFSLASAEQDRQHFRWLIGAFFNAAYSYFETSALTAYVRFIDHETGEPVEDSQSLDVLRTYVRVFRKVNRPEFVKTSGLQGVTKELYDLRNKNTHRFSLPIMAAGENLPEDYHFGSTTGEGKPALAFCRSAIELIRRIDLELQ